MDKAFSMKPEMNREIASASEKSEASFYARRTAAVSRSSIEPCAHLPDWSLERAHGAGRRKRERTARRLDARALNVYILERPDAQRDCRLCFLLSTTRQSVLGTRLFLSAPLRCRPRLFAAAVRSPGA